MVRYIIKNTLAKNIAAVRQIQYNKINKDYTIKSEKKTNLPKTDAI